MTTKKVFIFPGQGSQLSGMGLLLYEAFPQARKYFDQADEILGYGIKDLMFHGAEDTLRRTEITQPAVYIYSYATYMANAPGIPDAVAGHSLGEITAIVAAEGLDFESGLRLVDARAKAMQMACEMNTSTMAAILGLDDGEVKRICKETPGIVVAANYNCPGQVVISGETIAVELAADSCKKAGAKRAILLSVGGAFHSPLMEPAVDSFSSAVNEIHFKKPIVPVYQNVDATSSQDPDEIKAKLLAQLTSSVLWTSTIENMKSAGIENFIEFGSKVLGGFVKKIYKDAIITSFE